MINKDHIKKRGVIDVDQTGEEKDDKRCTDGEGED